MSTSDRLNQHLLSYAQERFWILDQFSPHNPLYNTATAVRLSGPIDVAALRQSLTEIVRRHDALRTTFSDVDGQPVQIVGAALPLTLREVNLSHRPAAEQAQELQLLLAEEATYPFDLSQGPLLRVSLVQLDQATHLLCVVMHRIITDDRSTTAFLGELRALYGAYVAGQPSPLADLPVQYPEFAQWQRHRLQGETLEGQMDYWRRQLSGAPELLEIPLDRPRPSVSTFQGARHSVALPSALTESLKSFSTQHGVNLFVTLLTAFQSLLHRYTGQEDICIGSPVPGRPPGTEGLVGCFANPLVLRTNLAGNPSFLEQLDRVCTVVLDAHANSDLPFAKLVDLLKPERSLSYAPLFQVMFELQDSEPFTTLSGLTLMPVLVNTDTTMYDLTLTMTDGPEGLTGTIAYSTDLFDAATIARMATHLQTLLESIVANPEERIGHLAIIPATELQQLLVDWNDTAYDYPKNACVHQLFEAQVAERPDATAVVYEGESLSYRELDRRANQMAHYLRSLGIGPEVMVGICMERSPEMVVTVLGVFKAGGAYVPMDPGYPKERLSYILGDTNVPVLLTQKRILNALPAVNARVICLDTEWEIIAQESTDRPTGGATLKDLAYVIYTSGSTGKPKGVMVEQETVCLLTCSAAKIFGIRPDSRKLQFASLAFDVSAMDFFVTLTSGATLVMAPVDKLVNPQALATLLAEERVTVFNLPSPSLLSQLPPNAGPNLETLITGGDVIAPPLVTTWSKRLRYLNAYGPTEATVIATYWEAPASFDGSRAIPIGRPLPNYRIHILDKNLQTVPVGIPGELHIGGDVLARGYLGLPEMTNQKFIPDPFRKRQGARLYKTGDLARYLPDGNIEFLGRIDNQVKVRGYRIELGEIETALLCHPEIKEAVAMAREDRSGAKRLIAYLVTLEGRAPTASELRRFLKEALPEFMIPSAFVIMPVLPLLPTGKVNRKALPMPDHARPDLDREYVAPRNPLEEMLTQAWATALGLEKVGIDDNFFDLGGTSLLALRIIAQVRNLTGKDVQVGALFQGATVKRLAELLTEQVLVTPPASPSVPIQPKGSKPPLFCVHPVGGNVFCYAELSLHLGSDQPVYGLQSAGLHGEQEPLTDIHSMASYFIAALRAIQPEGPYYLAGWSMGGVVAFEMASQLEREGQKVGLLALLDSVSPTPQDQAVTTDAPGYLVQMFANDMERLSGCTLGGPAATWAHLSIDEQLSRILEQAKEANLFSTNLSLSQLRQYFNVFKLNMEAMWRYSPVAFLGKITLFKAAHNLLPRFSAPDLGWGQVGVGAVNVVNVSGDHYTLLSTHVQEVAQQLRTLLEEPQSL